MKAYVILSSRSSSCDCCENLTEPVMVVVLAKDDAEEFLKLANKLLAKLQKEELAAWRAGYVGTNTTPHPLIPMSTISRDLKPYTMVEVDVQS